VSEIDDNIGTQAVEGLVRSLGDWEVDGSERDCSVDPKPFGLTALDLNGTKDVLTRATSSEIAAFVPVETVRVTVHDYHALRVLFFAFTHPESIPIAVARVIKSLSGSMSPLRPHVRPALTSSCDPAIPVVLD
jgi:hypothetical protein